MLNISYDLLLNGQDSGVVIKISENLKHARIYFPSQQLAKQYKEKLEDYLMSYNFSPIYSFCPSSSENKGYKYYIGIPKGEILEIIKENGFAMTPFKLKRDQPQNNSQVLHVSPQTQTLADIHKHHLVSCDHKNDDLDNDWPLTSKQEKTVRKSSYKGFPGGAGGYPGFYGMGTQKYDTNQKDQEGQICRTCNIL